MKALYNIPALPVPVNVFEVFNLTGSMVDPPGVLISAGELGLVLCRDPATDDPIEPLLLSEELA